PLQGIEQLPELVVRFHTHFVAQFTAGDAIGDVYRRIEGTHDRTDQEEEDRRGDTDAKDDRADDEPTITRVGTLRFVAHLLSDLDLSLEQCISGPRHALEARTRPAQQGRLGS